MSSTNFTGKTFKVPSFYVILRPNLSLCEPPPSIFVTLRILILRTKIMWFCDQICIFATKLWTVADIFVIWRICYHWHLIYWNLPQIWWVREPFCILPSNIVILWILTSPNSTCARCAWSERSKACARSATCADFKVWKECKVYNMCKACKKFKVCMPMQHVQGLQGLQGLQCVQGVLLAD